MAVAKKPKIVVTKEDFSAQEVASEQVATVVSGATVRDAVSLMATDFMPEESDLMVNDDFGVVEVSLTDKQAKDLEGKPGVEAVEDDEEVFAFADDGPGHDDSSPFDDSMVSPDEEAAAAIDEMMGGYQAALLEQQEETAREEALLAAQTVPVVDDEGDFDETYGNDAQRYTWDLSVTDWQAADFRELAVTVRWTSGVDEKDVRLKTVVYAGP